MIIKDFVDYNLSLNEVNYSPHITAYSIICKNIINMDDNFDEIIASKISVEDKVSVKEYNKILINILRKGIK